MTTKEGSFVGRIQQKLENIPEKFDKLNPIKCNDDAGHMVEHLKKHADEKVNSINQRQTTNHSFRRSNSKNNSSISMTRTSTRPSLSPASSLVSGRVRFPSNRSLEPKRKSDKVSARRLKELEAKYEPIVFEKTSKDMDIIRECLTNHFIFKKATDSALDQIILAFEPLDGFKRGDVIIRQGDEVHEYFYILGQGSVIFEVDGNGVGSADLPGDSFGDLALLYESPRSATVRANSDELKLYRVDQVTFRYILQSRSKFKTMGVQAVTKVKALNRFLGLVNLKAATITDSSDEDEPAKTPIVVVMDKGGKESGDNHLLLHDDIESDEDSYFEICDYESHSSNSSYAQYIGSYTEKRKKVRSSMSSTSGVSVEDFQRDSILGEGQYGEVWLAQPKIEDIDQEKFALKIQSKDSMNRAKSHFSVADAVRRECDILLSLCHPCIVDFVSNFEDDDNIYMVMGLIDGKELWDHIYRESLEEEGVWLCGIPEDHAKFYGLIIADTLHYMHRQNICHRDIKPENIMVKNCDGYPVLIDFGFAKRLPVKGSISNSGTAFGDVVMTYTFCGTLKYTAPEIITNDGHGCAVDQWSLGVLIFEMVSGENPFWYKGISDVDLLDDICNQDPFPLEDSVPDCSEEIKDVISKLLEKDPFDRLAGRDLTSHPWFDGLDIHAARRMALPNPGFPNHS